VSPILDYTTTIDATRTAVQINHALARAGAHQVTTLYAGGEPTGISFGITTEHGPRSFELPANVEGVWAALKAEKIEARYRSQPHARRVAWRILKDWIDVNLAVVQAGMANLDTVMLPYMLTGTGSTLGQEYHKSAGLRSAIEAS
jgi:hypothetical protein